MNNNYYIYLHIKSIDGTPFYVGKGKDQRAFIKRGRSKHWNNIVNKYGFDIIILEDNLLESEAFEKEIYWIKRIGRKDLKQGTLVNYTDGGEGPSGYKCLDETKEKLRQANLGKKQSKDTIYKRVESLTGQKRTDEQKKNISKSLKNYKHTDDFKEKCRLRQLGKESHRKGKSRFANEEEKKESIRLRNRLYKLKKKQKKIDNGNK